MKDRDAAEWEELARREPYFAVLTNDGARAIDSSASATAAYFETGEADVAALLATIASLLGRAVPLTSVLDFGCGAGRATLPLARRASRVVACDIAPTMLKHCRDNAKRAGLHNITFITNDALSTSGRFDFITSLLVFQHIPPAKGHALIRNLVDLLAPGGIAALHLPLLQSRGNVVQLARWLRARSKIANDHYGERRLVRDVEARGARVVAVLPSAGAVLIIAKPFL
jgi:cyclopropane fatty-acyl-phospholipid synthase-like methyltransferase